jgi:2-iminobutanoate/2-iminopropanoate deaminase
MPRGWIGLAGSMELAPLEEFPMRTVIPGAQTASGRPISGAVIANGFVFVSGQSFVGGADVEAQTRGVIDKIARLLDEAGTDLAHAVRCTVYMADLSLRDRMTAVYREYFSTQFPARTVVGADLGSPECLVEIECTAVVRDVPG